MAIKDLSPLISRRQLAAGAIASTSLFWPLSARAQQRFLQEQQWAGDSASSETLTYDPEAVLAAVNAGSRADYAPRDTSFASNFLASCQSFIGNSRDTTPSRVADYLALFGLSFRDQRGNYVPFCAAGASFAAAHSYVRKLNRTIPTGGEISTLRNVLGEIDRYHFYPSPSVWDMVYVAQGKRRWVTRGDIDVVKPGWLIIYDWEKNGGANHVGVVERHDGKKIHTIEFNTASQSGSASQSNGGLVTRRIRNYDGTVKGFIRTDARSPFDMDT